MIDVALRVPFRRRRWAVPALVVSLALNAFFIGATATDFLRFRGHFDSEGSRALRFELKWMGDKLPRDGFNQVTTAVAALQPSAETHIAKLKQLRVDLGNLVAAATPDRAAIDAKLGEIRAELQTMQREVQGAVIDSLLKLPPEMRAELAEASGAAKH